MLGACFIALIVLSPLLVLAILALNGRTDHWAHLFTYVLPNAAGNTALLLFGVGVLVACLGTGAAWLVTAYTFASRNVLRWALLLPLAVPTYIVAFAYLDLLHPLGPVQGLIRNMLGYASPREFRLPDLRGLGGAIFLLGFVLYPYVYLSTRVMFATQAASLLEAGRSLGLSGKGVFFRVALPLARPAIAVGLSLALLETLNDIGASEFLGVQTLTVSVYTTWITRSDLGGAAQIALAMLTLVVGLIAIERYGRRHQRYTPTQRLRPIQPRRLEGLAALVAITLGWLPVLIGFAAPALYLLVEAVTHFQQSGGVSSHLLASLFNTLQLAGSATVAVVACGVVVIWASRIQSSGSPRNLCRLASRAAALGYAIPGTVLAIGLLTPLVMVDGFLSRLAAMFGMNLTGLVIMGSSAGLVCAYTIRFLAISSGSLESGLMRIPPSLEQASRLLGETATTTLRRVHWPLLRPAVGAAALLVFVDAMKELPTTLLLRPVNFDTLATWLYAEAARGTYEEGAIAALAIVLAGLLPVILLARNQLNAAH